MTLSDKNTIKVTSKTNNFVVKDNVIFAKPNGVTPMVGPDNRMFIRYDLGLSLFIPNGYIALLLPPNEASTRSLAQSGSFVLLPGAHDVVMDYKINTDAVPKVFEKDDVCAQIVFINTAAVLIKTEVVEESKPDSQATTEITTVEEQEQGEVNPITSAYEEYDDVDAPATVAE
jgi:hypothetical protein